MSNLEGKVAPEAAAYVVIIGRRQSAFDKAKADIGEPVSAVLHDVANPRRSRCAAIRSFARTWATGLSLG